MRDRHDRVRAAPEAPAGAVAETTPAKPDAAQRWPFAGAVFLSAFLLFQVQLVAGKALLPWFGGTPAMWTTCMLVYQLLLLAGYAYAAGLARRATRRRQIVLHRWLLGASAALLAVRGVASLLSPPPGGPGLEGRPVVQIVLGLAGGVGLPFFVLSTTGPLLQSWLAAAWPRRSPYRYYALSNLGSLLALFSYPTLVEPALDLTTQARLWSAGYLAFVIVTAWCSAVVARARPAAVAPTPAPGETKRASARTPAQTGRAAPGRSERLLWFALSACGSLLLLAGTSMICQDVAAVPLLWVLPLGVYLLTFILCFESERWYRRGLAHAFFGAVALVTVLALSPWGALLAPIVLVAVFLLALLAGCLACHGELARLKPPPARLTEYYLVIAAGGAAGGVFTTLVAPLVFPGYWEFHLALAAAAVLLLIVLLRDHGSWLHARRPWLPLLIAGTVCLVPEWEARSRMATLIPHALRWPPWLLLGLWLAALHAAYLLLRYRRAATFPVRWNRVYVAGAVLLLSVALAREALSRPSHLLARTRSFYGVLTVQEIWPRNAHEDGYELRHGRTTHGLQLLNAALRSKATTYFGRHSGVGLALIRHPRPLAQGHLRVGVVGLGVGTLAAYAEPGDSFRFYEINPEVIRFARGERGYFSFLRDCRGELDVVSGDARVSLTREAAQGIRHRFDVLAIDAFSGDAIPVHLLTREAFDLYLGQLADDGILAVHVSSKALDLSPVLGGLAEHFGLRALMVRAGGAPGGVWPSHWVLLSRSDAALADPEIAAAGGPLPAGRGLRLWTDQFSNVFSVLR